MTDLFQEPDDATPLPPEQRIALRQPHITSRLDLNLAEEANIAKGLAQVKGRRGLKPSDLLSTDFACRFHKQIFGDVWTWAGDFRTSDVNIGCVKYQQIAAELKVMFDDVRYWIEHKTYLPDEIAVRLHHRLVAIHPFTNGNGRSARLMADLLVERLGGKPFTWGGGILRNVGELRTDYIAALKAADNHDIGLLIAFARS
jgi:Fic-DOC domain mobile mystery protein B